MQAASATRLEVDEDETDEVFDADEVDLAVDELDALLDEVELLTFEGLVVLEVLTLDVLVVLVVFLEDVVELVTVFALITRSSLAGMIDPDTQEMTAERMRALNRCMMEKDESTR